MSNFYRFLFTTSLLISSFQVLSAGLLTPVGMHEQLDIESHNVQVNIDHGFAVIEVEQVFSNPHDIYLEAIYSFPVPDKASVGEFTYWINGTPISGEVVEKKQAREVYEQQKAAGKDAALVEKNDIFDFQISVSQVPPKQDVRIKLVYIQPVNVDQGIGRFVYPLESGGTNEAQKSFWLANETVKRDFAFDLALNSGYPVDEFRLPAHPNAHINNQNRQQWQVHLDNQDPTAEGQHNTFHLNQDIVVYWRLASDLPAGIDMMTYRAKGQKKGTFLMTLTPGNDLAPLNEGRDWILVLDYSGSMSGKYDTLIEGVRAGFHQFSPQDRVKVILFNDDAIEVSREFVPTEASALNGLFNKVSQFRPNGGTNLYAGLKRAVDALDADRTSAIWLVTDGVANVGETQQNKFVSLVKQKDVRLFTFIMGNSANQPLLKGLTKASNGFALNVSNSDDISGLLLNAASKVSHQALRNIQLSFSGAKLTDVYPDNIPSLYRGQQLMLTGHYWGDGNLHVTLSADKGSEKVSYTSTFAIPDHAEQFPELERLWAFNQIETMMEQQLLVAEDSERREAITNLAIDYGLVTDYTSMLVVEEDVFDALGISRRNQQRTEQENAARAQRLTQPLASTRVDKVSPMFQQPRANYSNSKGSGGSAGIKMLFFILMLIGYRKMVQFTRRLQHLS